MSGQTLGRMIASLRKERGMTQLELAERMGVTDKAVSKWEWDLSCPSVETLPKLAELFRVSVDELMQVKPDVIAVDATCRRRPDGRKLEEFYAEIREKYPQQLLMADCSTMQEMLYADKLGFDFIGTTLVGYTEESKGCQIEKNDFELIRELIKRVKHPVIGEGNINTPQKLKRVMEIGVYSVVIGSAITRPQLITKKFTDALKE